MQTAMEQVWLGAIGGVGLGLLIGFLFAKIIFYQRVRKANKKAVKHSRATTLGYVSEAIAPLLPEFPYHYKDLMFLGKGVDYIVFDGLSEGSLRQIVFLEIKSGGSRLNLNEKRIKEAVDRGKISYKVRRI